jgi:hypothetical protein
VPELVGCVELEIGFKARFYPCAIRPDAPHYNMKIGTFCVITWQGKSLYSRGIPKLYIIKKPAKLPKQHVCSPTAAR